MMNATNDSIVMLVKRLKQARAERAARQETYDVALRTFVTAHEDELARLAVLADEVRDLETKIRGQGAEIAEMTRLAPAPGTKVRFSKVIRYRTIDEKTGEITVLDKATTDARVRDYIIAHGWTSWLKPDVREFEGIALKLSDEERPKWCAVEWETTVSIDRDLSQVEFPESRLEPMTPEEWLARTAAGESGDAQA